MMANRDETTLRVARGLHDKLTTGVFLGGNAQRVSYIQCILNELLDAELLSSNPAGKVVGYTTQSDEKVALVNEFKAMEERLYRAIENAEQTGRATYAQEGLPNGDRRDHNGSHIRRRDPWVEEAIRHFAIGFMALNRAVFQPQRIRLPEDEE